MNPQTTAILDLVGNTPMVEIGQIDTGPCRLLLKLESQNPGGSITDRSALAMVEAAARDGRLQPGGVIVEGTTGNTGMALALIAIQRGYRLIIVMPDKVAQEKVFHLRAMGVEVVITRSDVPHGHPEYYRDKARALAEATQGAVFIDQFDNPANAAIHEQSTGPEIWRQTHGEVDAVVIGVGSGGTLTGLGRYFARQAPAVEMILADPKGSVLAPYVQHGVLIEPGNWLIEGIGEDFIPPNCDLSLVSQAYSIPDEESIATAREVLRREGILCGASSGTLIAAALRYCREQTEAKTVVTFVCDSGNKYLSRITNQYWLSDHGLTNETETHDLRDLIGRSYVRGEVVSVTPADTLQQVYAKMHSFDISQVPVIDKNRIVGIMDETDVLLAVVGNPQGFTIRVGAVMTDKLDTIAVDRPLRELIDVFDRGHVAIVMEGERFLGLITPIDFLNHLRRRTAQA